MLHYQFYWYNTVYYCPSTSPTDMIQSITAMDQSSRYYTAHFVPESVLLI